MSIYHGEDGIVSGQNALLEKSHHKELWEWVVVRLVKVIIDSREDIQDCLTMLRGMVTNGVLGWGYGFGACSVYTNWSFRTKLKGPSWDFKRILLWNFLYFILWVWNPKQQKYISNSVSRSQN